MAGHACLGFGTNGCCTAGDRPRQRVCPLERAIFADYHLSCSGSNECVGYPHCHRELFSRLHFSLVITALLTWKTELITFSGKLTVAEIRATLLLGFLTAVVYPLLPDHFIDPWTPLISVPLAHHLYSCLAQASSTMRVRQFGARGRRYSAFLGGLVNSAATTVLIGQEAKDDARVAAEAPQNLLLSDLAMILRNWGLVVLFALPQGLPASLLTVVVLVPMMLVTGAVAVATSHRLKKATQKVLQKPESDAPDKPRLRFPLELRSVLGFARHFSR